MEHPVQKAPRLTLSVKVDSKFTVLLENGGTKEGIEQLEVLYLNFMPGADVDDVTLRLINRYDIHDIVRNAYGIPKRHSLREFLMTGERPWDEDEE